MLPHCDKCSGRSVYPKSGALLAEVHVQYLFTSDGPLGFNGVDQLEPWGRSWSELVYLRCSATRLEPMQTYRSVVLLRETVL